MLHVEEFIDMLLQLSALGSILARQSESLFEFSPHSRRIFINFLLIPPLLQIVCTVIISAIRIAEGDISYVVARHLVGAW